MLYVEGLTQTAIATIYTLSGERILTKPIHHSFDVSHLTTGIYMLRLIHNGTTIRIKLVKQ
jgi:hypothetical protein